MRPSSTRDGAHLGHEMIGSAQIDSVDERPADPALLRRKTDILTNFSPDMMKK